MALPPDISWKTFIVGAGDNPGVPKRKKESLYPGHLVPMHFHVSGHPADSTCTGPVSHEIVDPSSFFIIPNPDRNRSSLLKISSRSHDEKPAWLGKQTTAPVSGKRHGLQDVSLHILQPHSIGLSRIEINLPFSVCLIETQNLSTLLSPLRRNDPARIHPVTIGSIHLPLVRHEVHDFRPSSIGARLVHITRVVALPPAVFTQRKRSKSDCTPNQKNTARKNHSGSSATLASS